MAMKRNHIIVGAAGAVIIAVVAIVSIVQLPRVDVPNFSDYAAGQERKDAFFGYLLPLVQERNQQILQTRQELQSWRQQAGDLSGGQKRELQKLAKQYRMEGFDPFQEAQWNALLARLDVVPPSLALAQAANESAWGTSRFARTAYNYYGQWCFEKGCGVVPKSRDTGKSHEVARFDSPEESVEAYMQNLNSHPAYAQLRQIRKNLRQSDQPITGVALAAGLERYSERGHEYIKELRSMIRYNELGAYDVVAD